MNNLRYEARRAAIARSLLELERQFGRKPPDEKQNAQAGNPGELKNTLPSQNSTALAKVQEGGSHD